MHNVCKYAHIYIYDINMDEQYTNTFKALSDTTRLKIVWLLSNIDSKVCVSEIMEVLCEQQYNVSRHLNILKKANIISEKKEGRWVYYYLNIKDDSFYAFIIDAIRSIPEKEMEAEKEKCKALLNLSNENKTI